MELAVCMKILLAADEFELALRAVTHVVEKPDDFGHAAHTLIIRWISR